MAESDYKKYWFIKLPKEFFNRHDIKILESMPNGKDYCLFYLKLLLESVTHNGELRFNETIPYDENMLSIVTGTDIDKVKGAMQVLHQLELVEMWDDKTIFMTEVQKMIGSETGKAIRMKEYRENKKQIECSNEPNVSLCEPKKSREKELELDKDIDIDKELYSEKEKEKEINLTELKKKLDKIKQDDCILDYDDVTAEEPRLTTISRFISDNNLNYLNPFNCYKEIHIKNIKEWQEYLIEKNKEYING